MFTNHHRKTLTFGWALVFSALLAAVPAAAGYDETSAETYGEDTSYSYARVVDGSSTVLEVGGDRTPIELHQPFLVGDQLWVPNGSRLEVALSDRSLLRFEGDARMVFENIAFSADTADRTTVLALTAGKMQLIVPEDALGEALPQIRTPDGTIYIHREGSFRLSVGNGWTELVVREGLAEMVTERSSLLIHPGEAGWFEGGSRPRLEVRIAGYRDELERWGDRLTEQARYAGSGYVDESLHYAAAPLAEHGAWIEIGGRHAWRPRIEVAWRPYSRGYWRHTPIGLTWVSYDPWGYVTHHYGSWDYAGGYGWVWYPGRVYAPARVHWYWGPRYVGWCPSGYYGNYYRNRHVGFGLHFGTYGWAGGSWGHFTHWTFSLSLDFGRRHHRGRYDSGFGGCYGPACRRYWSANDLARERRELERGIITTDPGRDRVGAGERYAALEKRLSEVSRAKGTTAPDVTNFVARQPMKSDVAAAVLRKTPTSADGSKPASSARGDWATGEKPLPTLAGTTRPGAGKPAASKPNADKPAASATLSRPSYRDKPAPIAREPLSKPSTPRPVVIEPRTSRPATSKPAPQISRPAPSKPEYSRPAPSKPSPQISRPAPSKPEYSRPAPSRPEYSRPAPSKPSPRISRPAPSKPEYSRPAPSRPEYSRPAPSKPSPRISRPAPSKPAPRISRPAPSKPAPKISRPAPSRPAPKASKPAPSRPKASASSSRSDSKAKASSSKSSSRSKQKKND